MPDLRPLPDGVAQAIRTRAFAALSSRVTGTTELSVSDVVFPAGHTFRLVDRKLVVPRDAALVFVDQQPGANWGHACRYQFFDPASGELVHEEAALFPPTLEANAPRLNTFHAPTAYAAYTGRTVFQQVDWAKIYQVPHLPLGTDDERFAVLFTSQISNRRHVEDIELAYRTLVDVYGFQKSHIKVLCYNGTVGSTDFTPVGKWDGDKTDYRMPINYSATAAHLQQAFDDLRPHLTPNSLLFVHTNNHGSPSGLCIDSGSVLKPADFGTMLKGLPALGSLVVTMEQCYSGAFQQPTLDNSTATRTVFASAVPATKVSAGAGHFDPWARHFFEALRGSTAYGAGLPSDPDTNHKGGVSMREAANYAIARNDNTYDDPQFAEKPAGCGDDIYLGLVSHLPGWWHPLLDGLQQRVPLHIPDPGPVEHSRVDVLSSVAQQHVIGLAKSVSQRIG